MVTAIRDNSLAITGMGRYPSMHHVFHFHRPSSTSSANRFWEVPLNSPGASATQGGAGQGAEPDLFAASKIAGRILASLRIDGRNQAWMASFQAMGTQCRMQAHGPGASARAFFDLAVRWVAGFEAKYSRFWEPSWISRLNARAGGEFVASDPETDRLLMMCHEMVFLTRGTFDPTALPLIRLWDWKAKNQVLPSAEAVAMARRQVGWARVQRGAGRVRLSEPGMALDLGGMGKEYAVDQVVLLGKQAGLLGGLVDFGADIRVWGEPADGRPGWHIGLEDPNQPGGAWCGVGVRDKAVATSGDYLRKIEINGRRYGHIVDVRSGQPVDNGCRAVSIIAPSCTLAGMLSTAAFVLGPVEGLKLIEAQPGVEGIILSDNNVRHASRRFYEYVTNKT